MKANEFVKKFGWSSLKIAVTLPPFYRYKYVIFYSDEIDFKNEFIEKHREYMFETQEVKRLVESHELVDSYGGLENAKGKLEYFDWIPSGSWNHALLSKAIADVESCMEVSSESS